MSSTTQFLDTTVYTQLNPRNVISLAGRGNKSGIFVDIDQTNSSLLMTTSSKPAVYIDKYQNIGVNTLSPDSQFTINSANGNCLQLRYNDTNKSKIKLSSDGKMCLSSDGGEVNIGSSTNFNIKSHNGSSSGLYLNNSLVNATATQLNYNNVTPGSASANKSLVLDSNSNISGINNISTSTLEGTLSTASQPNITSLGTLTSLNINGNLTGLTELGLNTTTTGRTLLINNSDGNCLQLLYNTSSGIVSAYVDILISAAGDLLLSASSGNVDITTHNGSSQGLKLNGTLIQSTADEINYLHGITLGTASGNHALVVDLARSISNINNINTTTISGNITTAFQPNLSSVNILNIRNHDGTQGLSLSGTLLTSSAQELNYLDGVVAGTASASNALITDSNSNISGINNLTATTVYGVIGTASQPNITSINVLDISDHDGSTKGLKLGGVLLTATASQINSIFNGGAGLTGNFEILNVSKDLILS